MCMIVSRRKFHALALACSTDHPDVQAFEVRKDDKLVAIFLSDNYSRQFKSSGAWMSEYRSQTKNLGPSVDSIEGIPIVSNNNNLAKGGSETLLSFDGKFKCQTCFHQTKTQKSYMAI